MRYLLITLVVVLHGCGGDEAEDPEKPELVVLLGTSAKGAQSGPIMGRVADELAAAGVPILPLDTPCHGKDAEEIEGLQCWRRRIEDGQLDLFSRYCSDLSARLDDLGVTQISAVGMSRGGYVAMSCAANDSRFRSIALLMPVTDLRRLSEFDGLDVPRSLDLEPVTDRRILVRIGENDHRVGTDAATSFAHATGATLQILDVVGHDAPEDGTTVRWLLAN